jgi:hypothetical protein
MCPFCFANAALMVGSVMSTGALTALVLRIRAKNAKNSVPNPNAKEETWEK